MKSGMKLALTAAGPEMVRLCGAVGPVRLPLRPLKAHPELTLTLAVTWVPDGYQPPGGVRRTVPAAEGLEEVETKYCAVKVAV